MEEDRFTPDDDDRRECGACWAIPGAMLFAILMLVAFLSNFTTIGPTMAR